MSHSDRPSAPQTEGRLTDAKGKKRPIPGQAKPWTLSAEMHPEWHAAIEDFKRNRLPRDVDIVRCRGIEQKIGVAVALLGGMSKAAIKAATGLSLSCIGSQVSRMHLSSKGATSSTFDRQRYEDTLKVRPPKAGGVSRCLIFRASGDHRSNSVDQSNERRRNAALGAKEKSAKNAEVPDYHKLKHEPWWTGIEVRKGVSVSAVPCLSTPFDFTI
ncbi:hypothetical protein [Methylosinus sp. LW3]|uniref:hypothetical protein n=1 Tax=Methylosinus sp. LW3 TaxID=107635 RepID=UPI00046680F3|nr:hypothetical protein [Methylosinus sp. LW3]